MVEVEYFHSYCNVLYLSLHTCLKVAHSCVDCLDYSIKLSNKILLSCSTKIVRLVIHITFHQIERESKNMNIDCLFCPDKLTGNRFAVSEHLYNEHSFTLGHPDNLVSALFSSIYLLLSVFPLSFHIPLPLTATSLLTLDRIT